MPFENFIISKKLEIRKNIKTKMNQVCFTTLSQNLNAMQTETER